MDRQENKYREEYFVTFFLDRLMMEMHIRKDNGKEERREWLWAEEEGKVGSEKRQNRQRKGLCTHKEIARFALQNPTSVVVAAGYTNCSHCRGSPDLQLAQNKVVRHGACKFGHPSKSVPSNRKK